MSSHTTDGETASNKSSQGQGKTTSRLERRKEWWAKHREVRSKLRDRSTLSKKEKFQMHELTLPRVDTSRGFRSTVVNNLIAATKKSANGTSKTSRSPPTSKQKVKEKPKTKSPKSSPDVKQNKAIKCDKRQPTPPAKPPTVTKVEKPEKTEDFKPELMSEVVIKTRDVVDINAANHIPMSYALSVGNLPHSITKEQLLEHFRKAGGVKSIRIPKEKGTGKGRGFAFMEFKNRIGLGIALRLHNTTLCGRKITVEFASSEKHSSKGKNDVKKENDADQNQSTAA